MVGAGPAIERWPVMQRKVADLMNPQPGASDERRVGLWISLAVAAVLALVFLPLLTIPLAAIAFLGVACARSANVNRHVGWISGFVFGIALAIAGFAGIVVVLALRLGWKF